VLTSRTTAFDRPRQFRDSMVRGAKIVLGARRTDRVQAFVKNRGDLSNLVVLACDRYGKLDVLGPWRDVPSVV
jgi:hypothetical protein